MAACFEGISVPKILCYLLPAIIQSWKWPMYSHPCGTQCTVFYFWQHEWNHEIPPSIHSKLFLHIFFKLGAHGVSHYLRLQHTCPCPLCTSPPPMRALCLSQPLLQQVPDRLLFLGIFGRRRGLEYLVLPLFTHIWEQAVTEWMRESQGERGSVASPTCILASHSIPTAMLPRSCSSMDLWDIFGYIRLFSL